MASIGCWSWDPQRDTVSWSAGLFQIAGRNPALGPPPFADQQALFTPESWQLLSDAVSRALSDGTSYQLELALLRPTGEARKVLVWGEVARDSAGQVDRLFGVLLDETERRLAEEKTRKVMDELELLLEERSNELQRKNIALSELLGQIDVERSNLEAKITSNIQTLLLPVIDKMIEKSTSIDGRYLQILRQNLQELTSAHGLKLSSRTYNLTPKERELCALIKGGFTVKEIAIMQGLSERTIETHRHNIRKKLNISPSKTNLATFLASL